jgi:hypothetical protein
MRRGQEGFLGLGMGIIVACFQAERKWLIRKRWLKMWVRKIRAFLERCSITEVIPSSPGVARGLRRKLLRRTSKGFVSFSWEMCGIGVRNNLLPWRDIVCEWLCDPMCVVRWWDCSNWRARISTLCGVWKTCVPRWVNGGYGDGEFF